MAALAYRWTASGHFEPLRKSFASAAFTIDEVYLLDSIDWTSAKSMAHEFAWLRDAWLSLPESIADLYPSPEHLRKRALIQAGFYDEEVIDVGTKAGALRVAASFRKREEFSLVIVRDGFVFIRSAKSQAKRAMKGDEFQRSKTAIMEIIADLIGVSPDRLSANAGRSAA